MRNDGARPANGRADDDAQADARAGVFVESLVRLLRHLRGLREPVPPTEAGASITSRTRWMSMG